MEKVQFKDFKIIPDINSVRREDISDDVYFSPAYGHYISNSRLKQIDPKSGGNPMQFKTNPKINSSSLQIGSFVHECLLQPKEFELAPKIGRPSAKLGSVMDAIPDFLKEGIGLDDAIKAAGKKVDYFANTIDTKVDSIKEIWNVYSKSLEELNKTPTDKTRRITSDKDWDIVNGCLQSCQSNNELMNLLRPIDVFGSPIEAHFEDAFFMDFIVTYKNKNCSRLPFKMKADSWTIDYGNKLITLNDLKTTGKSVQCFMKEDTGSFYHYNYARQMYCYSQILWYWCMYNLGVTKKTGWKLKANMLVVETIPNYWSRPYYVSDKQLQDGRKMFNELMYRVAYCDMFGWDKEIEFEYDVS